MNRSTTVLLILLTAAAISFVLLHERKAPPRDLAGWMLFDYEGNTLTDGEMKLEFDPAAVAGIDVKRGTEDTLSFRLREDATWDLVKGVRDRASRDVVDRLIGFCTTARIVDTIDRHDAGGAEGLAEIGLDDAGAIRVNWRTADGSRIASLRIGRTAPLGNAMYVRVDNNDRRPDIYLVHPDIREFLAGPVENFRDPYLAKYPSEEIQRFSIRQGEGEIEFSRTLAEMPEGALPTEPALPTPVPERLATPWVISRPLPNARAYQEGVNDLLGLISGAKVASFSQSAGSPAVGADKPQVEVSLWSMHPNDGKGTTLSFFPDTDPDSKFALCRDRERKAEFKVEKSLVDSICLLQNPNMLRDQSLCDLNAERINTIVTDCPNGESAELFRIGDRWSFRPAGSDGEFQVASTEAVVRLIRNLNRSEVLGYPADSLTDPAAFGFDRPVATVTFGVAVPAHASLNRPTPLTPETSRTLRVSVAADGNVFANFAGEPFVYSVGPEVPEAIPDELIAWRSLQLPAFSRQQIVSVTQTAGTAPPVTLTPEERTGRWLGERAGEDVTDLLDPRTAGSLGARVGSLQVTSWQSPTDAATQALDPPAATIAVRYREMSADTGAFGEREIAIELAPMNASGPSPYYYGRHSGLPGVFLLDGPTARALLAPVLKSPARG